MIHMDERLKKVIPEEMEHCLKIRELSNSIQAELEESGKKQLVELLEIVQTVEGKLMDKCIEADEEKHRCEVLFSLGGYA